MNTASYVKNEASSARLHTCHVAPLTSTIADTQRLISNCREPNAILQATSAFACSKG